MAAILQLSQYCTFTRDSISTVITEPGQPVSHCGPSATLPSPAGPASVSSSTPHHAKRHPAARGKAQEHLPEAVLQLRFPEMIQIISAILMTTVASVMQLKVFLSSSFFWPNPAMLDFMQKG